MQDSAEYKSYINDVLNDFRELNIAYMALKAQVEKFFSQGNTILLTNRNTGNEPVMTISLTTPFSWTGPRGPLGYPTQFLVEPQFQSANNRTLCGYDRGIPNNVVRLDGVIEPAAPFSAHVIVSESYALFNNQFNGCNNDALVWNGIYWVGSLSPYDLMPQ